MAAGRENAEIKSLEQLPGMKLAIPSYQRPYQWTKKNVADLLEDIDQAIERGGRLSCGGDAFPKAAAHQEEFFLRVAHCPRMIV